jgi:hypothetical protein
MGTEEFWVPALLAAAGTGASYVNQQQANTRQNEAEVQAQQNQSAITDKANAATRALTQQIAKDTPQTIAGQATGDYVSQLRKNAAGSTQGGSTTGGTQTFGASTSSLAPVSGASSRYSKDTAASQKEVESFGNTAASEMGSIDAATRQRQNEGLAMGTLGTQLNTLGAQSYGQNFVDQLRAQASGQANPWISLASGLLNNAGKAYSMNAGGKTPGSIPFGSSYVGDTTGATANYA